LNVSVAKSSASGDLSPLPWPTALRDLARCAARSALLLARRDIAQPADHVGEVLAFADGTHGRVYRETARKRPSTEPVFLVVTFRLRWVRSWGHAVFRAESLLNTPLFIGFPGFVSKLWVAHDETGAYRGVYQWDGEDRAHAYVRALWWVLALVSERGTIHYIVVPGLRRDDVIARPAVLEGVAPDQPEAWWRVIGIAPRSSV